MNHLASMNPCLMNRRITITKPEPSSSKTTYPADSILTSIVSRGFSASNTGN